jgi:uncharacterized iron-regulated membrane protein
MLGLSSGIIVFIIVITGCLHAFQEEIQNYTEAFPKTKTVLLAPMTIPKKEPIGKQITAILTNILWKKKR